MRYLYDRREKDTVTLFSKNTVNLAFSPAALCMAGFYFNDLPVYRYEAKKAEVSGFLNKNISPKSSAACF